MRYRTLLSGATLAVLALTAAGCASGSSAAAGSAGAGSAGAGANAAGVSGAGTAGTAVSAAQARKVFDSFRLASYKYGSPVFYRPALTSYPRWFAASVIRTASAAPARSTTAGVRLSARGQVLMVFYEASAYSGWQEEYADQLAPGQSLPTLATPAGATPAGATSDSANAVAVPLDDSATLGEPQVVGPLQAAVVDDGPASAASRAVAAGPLTTGIYQYQDHPAARYAAPSGDVRQWALEGSNFKTFALRTASGGALVFYAMYLNTIVETPSVLAEASPLVAGPPIAIPPEFAKFLPPKTRPPRYSLETQYLLTFAAVDPPSAAAGAKISVVAEGGGPNWANV